VRVAYAGVFSVFVFKSSPANLKPREGCEGSIASRQTFTRYLHRPGVMKPDLKVVNCESAKTLTRLILDEIHRWGRFAQIDIYDETDEQICSITVHRHALN